MTGNLIIVSAPSGAGKTTLVGEVLKRDGRARHSISYTSRAPRPSETNGVDYHFVTREDFEIMIERGDFLEWAQVHGNLYGTSRHSVEELRAAGFDAILTIDVQGAEQSRKEFPDAIGVFILPPSYQILLKRLDVRGANHSDDLDLRLTNALDELAQYRQFAYLIINDDLEQATRELHAIVIAERCRISRRQSLAEQILQTFSRSGE